MKLAHDNFDGFLFWVHNGKENMEAGTICFEVRVPRKNRELSCNNSIAN